MGLCSSSDATPAQSNVEAKGVDSKTVDGAPPPTPPKVNPDPSKWVFGPGDPISQHYDVEKKIGEPGQFGYAQIVVNKKNKKKYVAKCIAKTRFPSKMYDSFRSEFKFYQDLNHPNIIKGYDTFESNTDLYFILQACFGGELFDRITARKKYSEQDAVPVFRQLMTGLAYLHSQSIAHCDLKPDNFLFMDQTEESVIKIIDFGMSKNLEKGQSLTVLAGTSFYMAPEVLLGKYKWHADIWSMGVVLFIMLFGYPPFHGANDNIIQKKIKQGFTNEVRPKYGPWFPDFSPSSEAARDLISRMIQLDTAKRLTAQEVLDHPWMTGGASAEPLSAVIKTLSNFRAQEKLKVALLASLTNKLDAVDVKELKASFDKIDANKDGVLTIEELKTAMSSGKHDDMQAAADFKALLAAADVDGDGKLSLDELLMAAANRQLVAKEERLTLLFRELDTDQSGKISIKEIESKLNVQNAAEMINEIDVDGDGQVNYQEFLAMWREKEIVAVKSTLNLDLG